MVTESGSSVVVNLESVWYIDIEAFASHLDLKEKNFLKTNETSKINITFIQSFLEMKIKKGSYSQYR